jgi:hypothetical protein
MMRLPDREKRGDRMRNPIAKNTWRDFMRLPADERAEQLKSAADHSASSRAAESVAEEKATGLSEQPTARVRAGLLGKE